MLAATLALAASLAPAEKPVLLVVGSPHLANNNRDVVKTSIEDVLTPARQREVEALVEHLARFRPTRVAVEWDAADQAGLDRRYADYRAGRLRLTANERDQIALRLAAKLNLRGVDAVDWSGDAPAIRRLTTSPVGPRRTARANGWSNYASASKRPATL